MDALKGGAIPVVAGFQGIDANGDITTLGRGGSDTTAVAAWPRHQRRRVRDLLGRRRRYHRPACARAPASSTQISYDDMLELSSAGAGVLQIRAVEFAKKGTSSFIPVRRSPTRREPISRRRPDMMEKPSSPASQATSRSSSPSVAFPTAPASPRRCSRRSPATWSAST